MKNTNMKNKVNEVRINGGSPFIKEDPNRIVSPSELLSGITGVTTEKVNVSNATTQKPNVKESLAYIAGKLYFDDLKNNIKDYDPSINPSFYNIIINDHPTVKNERFFTVIIMTKNEPTEIARFNIENAVGGWDVIINDLAKTIATVIKAYQSNEIDLTHISINKKNENNDQPHSKEKVVIKNQEVITKNSNDEKLQYPILVEQVKQEEFPELEKAKKITSESEIIDVVLEPEETNTNLVPVTSKYKEKGKDNIFGFLTDDEYDIISNITRNICNHDSKLKSSSIYAAINEIIDSGVSLLYFYLKFNSGFTILDEMKGIVDGTESVNPEYDKIIVEKIYPYFCKHYFSN